MVPTGYSSQYRAPIISRESNRIRTVIHYADGLGVCIQHICRNKSYFSHSLADPNLPTGEFY